ncbi:MAG TPA: DUF167 domain-containing protein [Terriglobales bacterium]|nr:DUF167 domain-containing protein [Terriglobales bacterium]
MWVNESKPGAKQPRVEETGPGTFVVAVRERAQEGEANRAIERALAAHWGVPPSWVRIVAGQRGRRKIVERVEG